MSKLQKMIYISLLVAQGVIIGLLENMIPYPFFCAWCKTRLSQSNHDRCHFYHEKKTRQLLTTLATTIPDYFARRNDFHIPL